MFPKSSLLLLLWFHPSHAFTSPCQFRLNSKTPLQPLLFAESQSAKVVPDEAASDETSAENPAPQVKLIECPCDQEDMPFYTLGVNIALQVGGDMGTLLTEKECDLVAQGFGEHLKGTLTKQGLDGQTILQQFGGEANVILQERTTALVTKNKAAGEEAVQAFQTENSEAVKTDSGLIYLETKAGEADSTSPTLESTIEFHYHGMLPDGTVVDSSKLRGEAQTIPLQQIIPGLREAVLKMKQGGTATILCPSELAYGDAGAGQGVIPGGATLKFEVELLQVVEADAAP